eukprot:4670104-Lingulodinium_polyedra.AAC.1
MQLASLVRGLLRALHAGVQLRAWVGRCRGGLQLREEVLEVRGCEEDQLPGTAALLRHPGDGASQ